MADQPTQELPSVPQTGHPPYYCQGWQRCPQCLGTAAAVSSTPIAVYPQSSVLVIADTLADSLDQCAADPKQTLRGLMIIIGLPAGAMAIGSAIGAFINLF